MSLAGAIRRTIAATAGALALLAPPALASAGQESVFMDDSEIVYAAPEKLDGTLAELKAIGTDRIRVSVYWRLLAPAPDQKQRPSFGSAGPASPAGYASDKWDRYDRIAALARKHGLGLIFSVTGPAPIWATGSPERKDIEETYEPNPADYRDFMKALGTRYSGTYRDEVPESPPPQQQEGGLLGGSDPPSPAQPEGELLPRVDGWSIWNEPNHPGWLTPQWLPDPRGGNRPPLPASARLYRGLVDAGWAALVESGHEGDTIMLGETAPRGLNDRGLTRAIRPLELIRELYCVDPRLRPFTGSDADVRACPGSAAAFVDAHPGLFRAAAWAHHPYALEQPPSAHDLQPDNVVLADLERLVRTLDGILALHGQGRRLPIWLTEYGYQTDPPDPTIGIPWARQAAYLNEAEYIAYRQPRVASTAQFLLRDDGPLRQFAPSDPRYWGTFQSGLRTGAGTAKRSYLAYQRPIHASPARVRRGRSVRIWGQLRTAADGTPLTARLEFRRSRGGAGFKRVRTIVTDNPRGYLSVRVSTRTSGWYRLVWTDPGSGRPEPSRRVFVRVVRR